MVDKSNFITQCYSLHPFDLVTLNLSRETLLIEFLNCFPSHLSTIWAESSILCVTMMKLPLTRRDRGCEVGWGKGIYFFLDFCSPVLNFGESFSSQVYLTLIDQTFFGELLFNVMSVALAAMFLEPTLSLAE
ncbi:hypothetical protein Bpfe_027814 [Biomphalaria pfeifferi]|uniref:Uncharacterized protein n=1 Tax=Biomphalaria pfeifferi TaxID=112525 RepID=A0AAD8AUQ6_BIOPF|nr:hypothetical protein Bpfe_027814 [Biomphalaria pfeifferi]